MTYEQRSRLQQLADVLCNLADVQAENPGMAFLVHNSTVWKEACVAALKLDGPMPAHTVPDGDLKNLIDGWRMHAALLDDGTFGRSICSSHAIWLRDCAAEVEAIQTPIRTATAEPACADCGVRAGTSHRDGCVYESPVPQPAPLTALIEQLPRWEYASLTGKPTPEGRWLKRSDVLAAVASAQEPRT